MKHSHLRAATVTPAILAITLMTALQGCNKSERAEERVQKEVLKGTQSASENHSVIRSIPVEVAESPRDGRILGDSTSAVQATPAPSPGPPPPSSGPNDGGALGGSPSRQ